MTDTDIKKDLKEIANAMCAMGDLKKAATITKAIDLINQQESQIEKNANKICKNCVLHDENKCKITI